MSSIYEKCPFCGLDIEEHDRGRNTDRCVDQIIYQGPSWWERFFKLEHNHQIPKYSTNTFANKDVVNWLMKYETSLSITTGLRSHASMSRCNISAYYDYSSKIFYVTEELIYCHLALALYVKLRESTTHD